MCTVLVWLQRCYVNYNHQHLNHTVPMYNGSTVQQYNTHCDMYMVSSTALYCRVCVHVRVHMQHCTVEYVYMYAYIFSAVL